MELITSANLLRKLRNIFSFIVAFFSFAPAQTSIISGTVTDSATGESIPYANVRILNSRLGAAANLRGFYLIARVSAGRTELMASAVGYRTKTETIVVHATDTSLTVNFPLAPEPVRMGEVTVSAVENSLAGEFQDK